MVELSMIPWENHEISLVIMGISWNMVIIWHLNQFLCQSTGWVETNPLIFWYQRDYLLTN